MGNEILDRQCRVFARYLAGIDATPYLLAKYRECHALLPELDAATPFDALLTGIASRGPAAARFADAYAIRFHRYGTLRKKLVLMLALLECTPPAFERLDRPGPRYLAIPRLIWAVSVSALLLVASVLVLAPAALALRQGKGQ